MNDGCKKSNVSWVVVGALICAIVFLLWVVLNSAKEFNETSQAPQKTTKAVIKPTALSADLCKKAVEESIRGPVASVSTGEIAKVSGQVAAVKTKKDEKGKGIVGVNNPDGSVTFNVSLSNLNLKGLSNK
jgi:hypothetical protein